MSLRDLSGIPLEVPSKITSKCPLDLNLGISPEIALEVPSAIPLEYFSNILAEIPWKSLWRRLLKMFGFHTEIPQTVFLRIPLLTFLKNNFGFGHHH